MNVLSTLILLMPYLLFGLVESFLRHWMVIFILCVKYMNRFGWQDPRGSEPKGKNIKTKTVKINLFALKTQICTVKNKEIIFHGSWSCNLRFKKKIKNHIKILGLFNVYDLDPDPYFLWGSRIGNKMRIQDWQQNEMDLKRYALNDTNNFNNFI